MVKQESGLTKFDALKIVNEVFERCFEHSDDGYFEMIEDLGFAEYDEKTDKWTPELPGMFDVFLAFGFTKKEISDTLGCNLD